MQIMRLPALGETMEMGTIIAWHKAEGDEVAVGDALYEVENEKSAIVVEAMGPGLLARIVAPVSTEVRVGEVVAVMAEVGSMPTPGEIAQLLARESHAGAPASAPAPAGPAPARRPPRPRPGPPRAGPRPEAGEEPEEGKRADSSHAQGPGAGQEHGGRPGWCAGHRTGGNRHPR